MKLSQDQEKAVRELRNFVDSGRSLFKLQGAAGCGKSTVISSVLSGHKNVRYAAPTAKAAMVLNDKGTQATTLHSLMFQPVEVIDPVTKLPKLAFKENPKSPLWGGGIVCVDEASMVPGWMAEKLFQYPIQVIAVGDPFQLPPVRSAGSLLSGKPDALLTKVHRQALDSPVLELATHIRTHGNLPRSFNKGGTSIVSDTREAGDLTAYDQIIVGKHVTRFRANDHVRKLKGRMSRMPEPGERVIAKRNDMEKGIINGAQYSVRKVLDSPGEFMYVEMVDEAGLAVGTTAWKHGFTGPEGLAELESMGFKDRAENTELWHAEAITAHASQGSEWDRILVVDESKTFRNNAMKWLYTAVSRASESVTVVRR